MLQPQSSRHQSTRNRLIAVGGVLLVVGGILSAIGLISFFSAFGGGGIPTYFWCAFLGLPMVAFGGNLLKMAFFGTVTRYMANEVAPVGRDLARYMASETQDAVRDVARAVGQGFQQGTAGGTSLVCPGCRATNPAGALFCNRCGYRIAPTQP